jgi:hypothetical protein
MNCFGVLPRLMAGILVGAGGAFVPISEPYDAHGIHLPSHMKDERTGKNLAIPGYLLHTPLCTGTWVFTRLEYGTYGGSTDGPLPERTGRLASPKVGAARSLPRLTDVGAARTGDHESVVYPRVVAINLDTGRTLQLSMPAQTRGLPSPRTFELLLPLEPGSCGVVVAEPGPTAGAHNDSHKVLWKWRVETGLLTKLGAWDAGAAVASVLDNKLISVREITGDTARQGSERLIDLRDTQGRHGMRLSLAEPSLLTSDEYEIWHLGQIIVPCLDHTSMVVVSGNAEGWENVSGDTSVAVCVDPFSSGGRRWMLDKRRLINAIGHDFVEVSAVKGLAAKTRWIALLVEDKTADQRQCHVLLLDERDGRIVRVCSLDHTPDSIVISAPGDIVAYTFYESGGAGDSKIGILEVDSATGTVRKQADFHRFAYSRLRGYVKRVEWLGSSDNSIQTFVLANALTARRIFVLDKEGPQ